MAPVDIRKRVVLGGQNQLSENGTLGTFILRNVTPLPVYPRRATSKTQLGLSAAQCTVLLTN